jgi:hypothetical protein
VRAPEGAVLRKKLLKIYGERNTGTNYLSRLVDLNLEVRQLTGVIPGWLSSLQQWFRGKELARDFYFSLTYRRNLGWKHSQVMPVDEMRKLRICTNDLSFVTLTRNPYSWLLSMYKRPYHQYYARKPDLESFLTAPWGRVRRENVSGEIAGPVELWNIKNASYIQLQGKLPALNLTFEALLESPEHALDTIGKQFHLDWKVDSFVNYDQSAKRFHLEDESKDTQFYRDYYLNEKWRTELSPQVISVINERLDENVMNYFGYKRLMA